MKGNAKRCTIGAAILVVALVTVLLVANWGTVRDHVEAWHFQFTRETRTFEPLTPSQDGEVLGPAPGLQILATYSNRIVTFDPAEHDEHDLWTVHGGGWLTTRKLLRMLREEGYRVLDQRFPRRAYVVIRAAETIPDPPIAETFVIPSPQR